MEHAGKQVPKKVKDERGLRSPEDTQLLEVSYSANYDGVYEVL
jgi:hypothetical protein